MMMIGITLSLGAVLVVWAGTSYGAFSGGSQLFYQQRQQALQENFVIEEVFFEKNTTGQIFIFVRNVGLININVVAIYVNGVSVASTLTTATTCPFSGTPSSANIPVGTPCEFTWPQTVWTSGTPFYIVVASARGNQVATTMRGP
jgi:hypothetical protein